MLKERLKTAAGLAMMSVLIPLFSACSTTGGGGGIVTVDKPGDKRPPEVRSTGIIGPPPHAPAHGHRRKYSYRYFPDDRVYYDIDRRLFFYLAGSNWQVSVSLPARIHLNVDSYVSLEMESDTPYVDNREHRKKYPPGKAKKNNKKK